MYNKNLFINNLYFQYFDFMTARGKILWVESIGIIAIPLANRVSLRICNIIYTLTIDSNLILFN